MKSSGEDIKRLQTSFDLKWEELEQHVGKLHSELQESRDRIIKTKQAELEDKERIQRIYTEDYKSLKTKTEAFMEEK